MPRGSIALYKVYAEPITASRDIHIGADLPVTEVIKVLLLREVSSSSEINAPMSI